ncbi:hypothetical protein GW17_00054322 [Ensete ventricosum]|nr:hypothetical protein GW17_00054322 [Ensete ventricosum]
MQWDLAGSSLGDSPKGSGNSLGACREITGRRPDDLPQECRRLPDWRKLGLSLSLWVWSSPKEDRYWTSVCLKKEDSGVDVGHCAEPQ